MRVRPLKRCNQLKVKFGLCVTSLTFVDSSMTEVCSYCKFLDRQYSIHVLQEALKLQPGAVHEACLLAQLYLMGGLPEDALDSARALRLTAPADSDAHALFILLAEAEGPTAETVTELSRAYLDLLNCDPASEHAIQGETLPR